MKIAMVSGHPAFPALAGNTSRIQQLAGALVRLGHEVTFVLLPLTREPVDDAAHAAFFGAARYVRITDERVQPERAEGRNWPGKWSLLQVRRALQLGSERMSAHALGRWILRKGVRCDYAVRQLLGREAGYYSSLDALSDPGWERQLSGVGRDCDAVIVEYVFNSWAFACFPERAIRVLDTHDAFADRHRSYLRRGISDFWLSLRPADENAGLRRADLVLAIQQDEADKFLAQLAREQARRDPHIAVVSHLMRQPTSPADPSVDDAALFVASDNAANRHAVDFLVRAVLPHVLREIPEFNLQLAGSICEHAPTARNVTKLGWVDNINAAFARAPISVNPLLVGTGINIKVLEAMAAGVPTVSTVTGARGVPPTFRNGIVTVPDGEPAAFAAEIVRFARSAALRQHMGRAAYEDAIRWNTEQVAVLQACLSRPCGASRPAYLRAMNVNPT